MPHIASLLTEGDIVWFARNGVRRSLQPDEAVATEGSPNIWLIIILKGVLSITKDGAGEIAKLGVGEFVGEMSLIDSKPASATVRAQGEARALFLDRWVVEHRLKTDVAFSARFYRAVAMFQTDRLRETSQQLAPAGAPKSDRAALAADDACLQRMLYILNKE